MKIVKSNLFYELEIERGKKIMKDLAREKGVYYNDASHMFLMTDKKWNGMKEKYRIGTFNDRHGYHDVEDYIKDVHKGEHFNFLGLDYRITDYSKRTKEYFDKKVDDSKEKIAFAEKSDWVRHIDDVLHNHIMKDVKKEFEKQLESVNNEGYRLEKLRKAFKSIVRKSG